MADLTRGERRVRLFALLISNPERKYTISNLMEIFDIPENERRNVQRDMQYLTEMDGGRYIKVSGDKRSYVYSSALKSASCKPIYRSSAALTIIIGKRSPFASDNFSGPILWRSPL